MLFHLWRRLLLMSAVCWTVTCLPTVDHSRSKVWGPGLKSTAQLPTRYVFVELMDTDGTRLSSSGGALQVYLSQTDGKIFSGRHQVIDRNDGSYIINYRPAAPVIDLVLSIKLYGVDIANSPYVVKGWIYQENCNCPLSNAKHWLGALQCPQSYKQLDEDLKLFPSIDMRKVEREVHRKWPKRPGQGALMHYVIKDNRVYRKEIGTICGFKMFTDAVFLSLARKVKLPDVEMFINLGDWPLVKDKSVPIFSWCGSDDTDDIILPTYDITDATMKSLSQVTLDLFTVQGPPNNPVWSEKLPKGLFRGRDSRRERLDLAKMSRQRNNSELLDAGITAFFFFPKDESLSSERINFFDFFKYKYQVNVDGTVAAYRFPYLMVGDSLVLKQDSPYYEHFYRHLRPWTHYIPLKNDLSDVIEQLNWAKDHDMQAKAIAEAGRSRARELLTPANIYCYYYLALKKYADRLTSTVEVLPDMEEATHPDYFSSCDCHRPARSVTDEL